MKPRALPSGPIPRAPPTSGPNGHPMSLMSPTADPRGAGFIPPSGGPVSPNTGYRPYSNSAAAPPGFSSAPGVGVQVPPTQPTSPSHLGGTPVHSIPESQEEHDQGPGDAIKLTQPSLPEPKSDNIAPVQQPSSNPPQPEVPKPVKSPPISLEPVKRKPLPSQKQD